MLCSLHFGISLYLLAQLPISAINFNHMAIECCIVQRLYLFLQLARLFSIRNE